MDFDSTFIKGEALEQLAEICLSGNPKKHGILRRIKQITDLGMEGKLPFGESLQKRLGLLPINKVHLASLVSRLKKTVTKSIRENKKFLKTNRNRIFIVSGGFFEYIWPVVRLYGLKKSNIFANRFIFGSRGEVVGCDQSNPLVKERGKALKVKSLGLEGNIYVVGDGYTDYEIKKNNPSSWFFAFTENIRRDKILTLGDFVIRNFNQFIKICNHGIKLGNI